MKYSTLLTLVACAATSFVGCGNDSGNDRRRDNETYIRVFNAVTDAAGVDVIVEDDLYFTGIEYLESSGYFRVKTQQANIQVNVTNSFTPIYDRDGGLDDQADNSLFIYGAAEDERAVLTKDENSSPGSNLSKVRIVNLSRANRKGIDVYVAQSDGSKLPSAPAAEALGSGAVSDYVVSSSGQYDFVVTSNNAGTPLVELSGQNLESKGVYTIVVADSPGGKLPLKAVLLKDSRTE